MAHSAGNSVRVVLFSGGTGSRVLSASLVRDPGVELTLVVNGYDDGKSTGEVRRWLGDSLGPSDFRKNASWLARASGTCDPRILELLDERLPVEVSDREAVEALEILAGRRSASSPADACRLPTVPPGRVGDELRRHLAKFLDGLTTAATSFDFGDCSVGNLVFAGCYLGAGRDFNEAVARYCGLVGLPPDVIENVTDGTDAHLVAVDRAGRLLPSEAAIVEAETPVSIHEIYLLRAPLAPAEAEAVEAAPEAERERLLSARSVEPPPNQRVLTALRGADLVVYAPGTQHSSLFPSYLTPGVGEAIARNVRALKVLITNIHEDAEIGDTSAIDLTERALYYLRGRGRRRIPAPCLVTHLLLNEPGAAEDQPYVPLGRLEDVDDPRLVRIANYEDEDTGRHDPRRVLGPLVESFLGRRRRPRVAVLLLEAGSPDAVAQTALEMVRAGIERTDATVTAFYERSESLDSSWCTGLPFALENTAGRGGLAAILEADDFDFVMLFESSGMYKGAEVVNVASLLPGGRFDAVWGSRRLSVRDIRHSYRLRYRHRRALGAISYVGSHALSVACLLLYGRYVSDTLSGVRAARREYVRGLDLDSPCVNQRLLVRLMRDRAEIFETPVQFFSLSPDRVRRTSVRDGLRSLATLVRGRWGDPEPTG